jgi:hypothetical protein
MNDQEQMGEIIVTTIMKKFKELRLSNLRLFEKFRSQCRYRKYFKTLPGVNSNNELVRNMLFEAEITMRIWFM